MTKYLYYAIVSQLLICYVLNVYSITTEEYEVEDSAITEEEVTQNYMNKINDFLRQQKLSRNMRSLLRNIRRDELRRNKARSKRKKKQSIPLHESKGKCSQNVRHFEAPKKFPLIKAKINIPEFLFLNSLLSITSKQLEALSNHKLINSQINSNLVDRVQLKNSQKRLASLKATQTVQPLYRSKHRAIRSPDKRIRRDSENFRNDFDLNSKTNVEVPDQNTVQPSFEVHAILSSKSLDSYIITTAATQVTNSDVNTASPTIEVHLNDQKSPNSLSSNEPSKANPIYTLNLSNRNLRSNGNSVSETATNVPVSTIAEQRYKRSTGFETATSLCEVSSIKADLSSKMETELNALPTTYLVDQSETNPSESPKVRYRNLKCSTEDDCITSTEENASICDTSSTKSEDSNLSTKVKCTTSSTKTKGDSNLSTTAECTTSSTKSEEGCYLSTTIECTTSSTKSEEDSNLSTTIECPSSRKSEEASNLSTKLECTTSSTKSEEGSYLSTTIECTTSSTKSEEGSNLSTTIECTTSSTKSKGDTKPSTKIECTTSTTKSEDCFNLSTTTDSSIMISSTKIDQDSALFTKIEADTPTMCKKSEHKFLSGDQALKLIAKIVEDLQRKNKTKEKGKENERENEKENEKERKEIPCNIMGSWSSTTGGMLLNIANNCEEEKDTLNVTLNSKTPPCKKGFLIEGEWKLNGSQPIPKSNIVALLGTNLRTRKVVAFIGECRVCGGSELITGNWLVSRISHDCEDQKATQQLLSDVWRREMLSELRKDRLRNLNQLAGKTTDCASTKRSATGTSKKSMTMAADLEADLCDTYSSFGSSTTCLAKLLPESATKTHGHELVTFEESQNFLFNKELCGSNSPDQTVDEKNTEKCTRRSDPRRPTTTVPSNPIFTLESISRGGTSKSHFKLIFKNRETTTCKESTDTESSTTESSNEELFKSSTTDCKQSSTTNCKQSSTTECEQSSSTESEQSSTTESEQSSTTEREQSSTIDCKQSRTTDFDQAVSDAACKKGIMINSLAAKINSDQCNNGKKKCKIRT